MTKHESKTDFLHKISKDFVCIFQIFRFLVKLKPNEKAIQKIICIDCDHGISKCPSISELPPLIIGPGMLPGLCNRPIHYFSFSGSPCSTHLQTRERGPQWPSAPAEFFKMVNGSYAGIFNPFIKKNVDIPFMLKSIL